jgi:hypothetical protein
LRLKGLVVVVVVVIILASYHSIILPQDFMLLILFITENYKFVVNLQFSSIYQIEGGPWPWHNGKAVARALALAQR